MGALARICRHPVKSLGEEALESVALAAGRHMPWDRVWSVMHANSDFDPDRPAWVAAKNSVTLTRTPALARIDCAFDPATGALTLTHPDRPPLTAAPDEAAGAAAIADWVAPLAAPSGPGPYRLARLAEGALTDFPDTHIAIGSLASLRALEGMAGRPLEPRRFRMNLWLDGFAPWEELEWTGREITVGPVRLKITDRIQRCAATHASPESGRRDTPVTELLHARFGHMDFGVYAQVVEGGEIRVGDPAAA